MNNLYAGFLKAAMPVCPYLNQYTYRQPIVIRPETYEKMIFLQKSMYKAIRHLVENYEDYSSLMPVSDRVASVLSRCKDVPYRVGTYRTDFLIDENKDIRLIEITCRFALNIFFVSGFLDLLVDDFVRTMPQVRKIEAYTSFFDHLQRYFGDFQHVCILKGDDNRNETRYICSVFEQAGYAVHLLALDEIAEHLALLENAAIIGELSHDEICRLTPQALDSIIHSNLLNDLRTVFLIHDKRFFSLLSNEAFLNAAMSREEAETFRSYIVPALGWRERRDIWEQARKNKEGWIIKPRALGKGIGVRAGRFTSEEDWQNIFLQDDVEDLTLQPYIQQTEIRGWVGEEARQDYVVGTLLFFEDEFFGPGFFRASSHPITNQGDIRKITTLVTPDTHFFEKDIIL
jgi:hypothetical protein